MYQDRFGKLQEHLRQLALLFRKLRLLYERCVEMTSDLQEGPAEVRKKKLFSEIFSQEYMIAIYYNANAANDLLLFLPFYLGLIKKKTCQCIICLFSHFLCYVSQPNSFLQRKTKAAILKLLCLYSVSSACAICWRGAGFCQSGAMQSCCQPGENTSSRGVFLFSLV